MTPPPALRVLTWNLYHGRDRAPERFLHTWRSRLLGVTERGERFAQVNRPLLDRFAGLLDSWGWDLALLQEARRGGSLRSERAAAPAGRWR